MQEYPKPTTKHAPDSALAARKRKGTLVYPLRLAALLVVAVCWLLAGCGGAPPEAFVAGDADPVVAARQAGGDGCSGVYTDPVNGTELVLDCAGRTAIFRFPGGG